jgi:hypothetical protein
MFSIKDIEVGRRRADPNHPLQRPIDWVEVYITRKYGSKHLTRVRNTVDLVDQLKITESKFVHGKSA